MLDHHKLSMRAAITLWHFLFFFLFSIPSAVKRRGSSVTYDALFYPPLLASFSVQSIHSDLRFSLPFPPSMSICASTLSFGFLPIIIITWLNHRSGLLSTISITNSHRNWFLMVTFLIRSLLVLPAAHTMRFCIAYSSVGRILSSIHVAWLHPWFISYPLWHYRFADIFVADVLFPVSIFIWGDYCF